MKELIIATISFSLFELCFWKGGFDIWYSNNFIEFIINLLYIIVGNIFLYIFLYNLREAFKR